MRIAGFRLVLLSPGAHEKSVIIDVQWSYPEPAQVPLGEKPKTWKINLVKGIRQISPVS